jgi:mono/diheme cytochrome c family protein
MSDWKDRLIYPPLYLIFLLAAIFFVYRAFTIGLERGEYVGKYDPHEEGAVAPVEEESYDLAAMLELTDELVGLGEELYNINCVSCHGAGGGGDGPKGAGLNPPPRNFASGEQFKQGGGTLQIFQTLNTGVPGSSMASFLFLNPRELMALSHYVRFFVPSPLADPPELVSRLAPAATAGAAAPQLSAGDSALADSGSAGKPQEIKPGRTLPVAFAVERILAEQITRFAPLVNPPVVYQNICANCHGAHGEGALVERRFTHSGSVYASTRPMSGVSQSVIADRQTLATFLAVGLSGHPGHRFPDLTIKEVGEIFESLSRVPGKVKQ